MSVLGFNGCQYAGNITTSRWHNRLVEELESLSEERKMLARKAEFEEMKKAVMVQHWNYSIAELAEILTAEPTRTEKVVKQLKGLTVKEATKVLEEALKEVENIRI